MHCVRELSDGIFWVGANDRRLALFENIHPIPDGVSYNSYLVVDDKTVLFDTVDWSQCRQMMENVEHLLGGRALDYAVVLHMEPDHAASLGAVLSRWPKAKIVSSAKAFEMMDHFGVRTDGHERIVPDEDYVLSTKRHYFKFWGAPMVHWPEVLFALDCIGGTLFTADAFGSFKSLDGHLFSDEVDFDRDWIDEARRYYTNIVGKYGGPVQSVMKRVLSAKVTIEFVAPLHGLVWKKRDLMRYFIGKLDKWSRYEPEERGVLIAYASMYGGTESAAQALAAKLCERGITDVRVRDVSSTHVSYLIADAFKLSHIVLASVTYNNGIFPTMYSFLHDMKSLGLKDRTFALIENGSWAPSSGAAMRKFITEEMKSMTVLDPQIKIMSSMPSDREADLDALADALEASVRG